MSRVRVINGTIEDMQRKGDEVIERKAARARVDTGCLSDPQGLVAAAHSRFEDIPKRESTIQRAKDLIRHHQVEDARFRVPGEADIDLVIVLHPKPQMVQGADGQMIEVERYMVFLRECLGTKAGTCYRCDNAQQAGRKPVPHSDCWRKRIYDEWVPVRFAWAHGIDDAEDMAKEMRSALAAEAEQELGGTEYGVELPFSNDWMAGYRAAKGNAAWSTDNYEG